MLPTSIKSRLIILVFLVAGLPILLSDYYIVNTAQSFMVAEKQQKLFGAGRMLDYYLKGTYEDLLEKHGAQDADRDTKVKILNQELQQYTDRVAKAYPGIGVGYYCRDLDAIITYGPGDIYADKVGLPISSEHEGRVVMESGVPGVQVGNLVRGQIMNTMQPLIRNGKVIGYIWANELTVDIEAQTKALTRHLAVAIFAGLLIGFAGVAFALNRMMEGINRIKLGLDRIKNDLSYEIIPPHDEIGAIALAINDMTQDLAAKKRLEEKVQHVERLAVIGEMAAGLAHEIRNPLMAVKGFAELQNEDITSRERAEYTNIIVNEVDRMNYLIERLLDFSKPTQDFTTLVQVNKVLKDTLVLAEIRVSGAGVQFETDFADHLPDVMANEEQLKQVSLNILLNAIQAIEKQGEIKIVSRYDDKTHEVQISISDNGPGIAAENVSRLFEPFFTTKENGTGLGLSVANYLMLSWGGSISVESKVSEGSTFTLKFPEERSKADDNDTSS